MAKPSILTAGFSYIEFVQSAKGFPGTPEDIILSSEYCFHPSGTGAANAVAAARCSADVRLVTRLGDDAFGNSLKNFFASEGIDRRFVKSDPDMQTGLVSHIVAEDKKKITLEHRGANSLVSAEDVENALLSFPDGLLLSLEIESQEVYKSVAVANKKEIPVFLDTGPKVRDIDISRLGKIEVFTPNEDETYAITGIYPSGMETCLNACIKLHHSMEVKYIVLKLSDRGSYVYDGKYCEFVPSYSTRIVDASCAGAAFNGALVKKYLENSGGIIDACRYANAAGAITVSAKGGIKSLPDDKQIAEFLKTHNPRY